MKNRKMKIGFFTGLFFCMLFIAGCGQESKIDTEKIFCGELGTFSDKEIDKLREEMFVPQARNILENYSVNEMKECGEKNIQGILCRENDILMLDSDNNCLLVLSKEGELLDIIGVTGNGPLEFLNPAGIAQYEGDIFILDVDNRRIQVLNSELAYKNEIGFPRRWNFMCVRNISFC